MTTPKTLRLCAALWLATLLSGCAAAVVAVPAMTAAGVLTQKKRAPAQTARPVAEPSPAAIDVPVADAAPQDVQLTNLTELPPPSGGSAASDAGSWQAFAAFAHERAQTLASGDKVESALLAPGSAASLQVQRQPCTGGEPAVIVDLDAGQSAFNPDATTQAPPELAAALARLREAGVVVLWISKLHANSIEKVAGALKESGLDPTGRDPILLVRNEEERKQVLRQQAGETTCVVAIAGDRRGDFDELFDYLRDPGMAGMYDSLLGTGWFIVPPPFEKPPAIEVPELSVVAPAGEDGGR